ncbi:hypothetical protein I4U23_027466 [Adineta vaga]|nr:hypothetical protein I4U23_027466 [Adineta vaga]
MLLICFVERHDSHDLSPALGAAAEVVVVVDSVSVQHMAFSEQGIRYAAFLHLNKLLVSSID